MIVLGDISGIQSYVFDVAEEGGGQARHLRARSFFVQLLAETTALRIRRALGWGADSVLLCGAGKFILRGSGSGSESQLLAAEQREINAWLLNETRGEIRLTLAWADSRDSDSAAYRSAQQALQSKKAQPWAPPQGAAWDGARLTLDPLDSPCSLCHHAPGTEEEIDLDGEKRLVCCACASQRKLGQKLPRARWLVIRDSAQGTDLDIFDLGINVVTEASASVGSDTLAIANLQDPATCPSWCPRDRFIQRRLMAHVPVDKHGQPVWFTELAKLAEGDRLLAVLKADADSLGVCFEQILNSGGLEAMRILSDRLDRFFAGRLRQELTAPNSQWQSIYTIFAGGDDLVMVGPWNVMLDFAGTMRNWFTSEFQDMGLTLSAGLELMKPKRPIRSAVERAESLLEAAKGAGKDRLAALGQIWEWKDHGTILEKAKRLVEWTNAGDIQRGWLHTLLELALARCGDRPNALATARLAYHVHRNWRPGTAARKWADQLINVFDQQQSINVRFLPAIVRYALTATRSPSEED